MPKLPIEAIRSLPNFIYDTRPFTPVTGIVDQHPHAFRRSGDQDT
ncbi:MAG: hypothetical protein OSB68_10075 [Dehalococcoidia bacterium]|nr:hypothetical protein [Dehalococcoidia bacterium]